MHASRVPGPAAERMGDTSSEHNTTEISVHLDSQKTTFDQLGIGVVLVVVFSLDRGLANPFFHARWLWGRSTVQYNNMMMLYADVY